MCSKRLPLQQDRKTMYLEFIVHMLFVWQFNTWLYRRDCSEQLAFKTHQTSKWIELHLFWFNGGSRQIMRNELTYNVMHCDDINYRRARVTCNGIGGPASRSIIIGAPEPWSIIIGGIGAPYNYRWPRLPYNYLYVLLNLVIGCTHEIAANKKSFKTYWIVLWNHGFELTCFELKGWGSVNSCEMKRHTIWCNTMTLFLGGPESPAMVKGAPELRSIIMKGAGA